MTKEDLQQLSDLIDKKLDPINNRLEKLEDQMNEIKKDITEIKEDTQITRAATNELIKWVEINSTNSNPFPVDKAI